MQRAEQLIGINSSGKAAAHLSLVMLHGLASNASRWREYMQHSHLNNTFELHALDLRGHGRSMTWQQYARADWVADVHQLVTANRQQCILAGHSMGAQVALDYASQYTDTTSNALRGLVLIDPVFPQALDGLLRRVARFRLLLKFACHVLRVGYALGLRRRTYPYRDLQALDEQTRAFLHDNPDKSIADLYMDPLADLPYMPLANYLQDLYEVTRPLKPLHAIKVPVLVLLSSGASTSEVQKNRTLLKDLAQVEIVTIEADHWLLTEKPDEARAVIDTWCQRIMQL
jgi:pimeloyl-ACP methyl ester carboxylesterase